MIITRFNDVRILRVITGRVITIKQGDYKIILAQWREITHSYVITTEMVPEERNFVQKV